MTIQQERDIAMKALALIASGEQHGSITCKVATDALDSIRREQTLQAIADQAQELDMGYGAAQASPVAQDDDAAETAYWRFDARKKGYAEWKGRPQTERHAFKAEFRASVAVPSAQPVGEVVELQDKVYQLLRQNKCLLDMLTRSTGMNLYSSYEHAVPIDDSVQLAIHYPAHWDTTTYPTVEDALTEVYHHFRCIECAPPVAQDQDVARRDPTHEWPVIDRVLTSAYQSGMDGYELDLIACRRIICDAIRSEAKT